MLDDQETLQILMRLGLNRSQAKVYYIMTRSEATKANILWKTAEVGRQDVYRILQELQNLGLIEKIVSAPTEYRAIPIAEGVSMLFQRKKTEVAELQEEATKLAEVRWNSVQTMSPGKQLCVMIPEKEINLLRIDQTFDRTQRSICVSSTFKRLSASLPTYKYGEAVKKGVLVRVVVNTEDKDCFGKLEQPFSSNQNFELRWIPNSPVTAYAIFDEREIYIPTNAESGLLDASMLWTNYPSIVNLALNYFEVQWNTAKEDPNRKPL